ncbi:MAG: hypothetical protein ACI96W_003530, partial [Paraglaciecola sp.]
VLLTLLYSDYVFLAIGCASGFKSNPVALYNVFFVAAGTVCVYMFCFSR